MMLGLGLSGLFWVTGVWGDEGSCSKCVDMVLWLLFLRVYEPLFRSCMVKWSLCRGIGLHRIPAMILPAAL